jgi:hypothetical protein
MTSMKSVNGLREKRSRIKVDGILWTIRATRSNGDLLLTRGQRGRTDDMIYSPVQYA